MPKAILELEMPESCNCCTCAQYYDTYGECGAIEYDIDGDFRPVLPDKGRRPDCPLKLVEGKENGCEYCNTEHNKFLTDDVFMATTNSYGDKNRVITSRHGLQYKTIHYCPMCGCRLEVES